jgi:(p)ppGpp synthase/HD superfamily hydrolase
VKYDYNNLLAEAIAIVSHEYSYVMDKGGKPYILHCLAVMYGVEHLGSKAMITAVLHDLIEDFPDKWSVQRLASHGFPLGVTDDLDILCHKKMNSYKAYIDRVACFRLPTEIKLADLRHNMRPERLQSLNKKDLDRQVKYHKAYQKLLEAKKKFDERGY